MSGRTPARSGRVSTREITELEHLKAEQPELATPVDLQISLLQLQRRVQPRITLPSFDQSREWAEARLAAGHPLLRFENLPIAWGDLGLLFRETVEILHRHDALSQADRRALQAYGREPALLKEAVFRWFNATADPSRLGEVDASRGPEPDMLDQVLLLAMRPFMARSAETILPRVDLSRWLRGRCPLCGGEPDFAVITPSAERQLICSRCTGRWPFPPLDCPFCGNDDRATITSFASRDTQYRLYACNRCQRYIKAYDGRSSRRPVMVAVDAIATMPLDAAAMQKGYSG